MHYIWSPDLGFKITEKALTSVCKYLRGLWLLNVAVLSKQVLKIYKAVTHLD